MPRNRIERILHERIGLHSSTVGSGTIARAIEQRMHFCAIETAEAYLGLVTHSDTELDALIEAVIVPETWFFRDPNAFQAFTDWLRHEWIPKLSGRAPLRVLSVPCASGEEPYTLAMCLAECGITTQQAVIDAVDISSVNLHKAREARYTSNSFRGDDLLYRDRYFDYRASRYHLHDEIRERVVFRRRNILDKGFARDPSPYHVIFCRNLLIYFDRPTQHRAIDRLEKLLASDGLLFLGHSETSLLQQRGFVPLPLQRCFGFRRAPPSAPAAALSARRRPPRPPEQPVPGHRQHRVPAPPAALATGTDRASAAATPATDANRLLLQAFELADKGRMQEAAACCEQLLRAKDCQADAHYLLGVIREAAGELQEAEQLFRKAVYLRPDHYEALVHLSVICAKTGDQQGARRLRERAARAQSHGRLSGATK